MSRKRLSRLDQFMLDNRIRPRDVTRGRYVACSRQHLLRLRQGRDEPTRTMMLRIAKACSVFLRRSVAVGELFDLEEK